MFFFIFLATFVGGLLCGVFLGYSAGASTPTKPASTGRVDRVA